MKKILNQYIKIQMSKIHHKGIFAQTDIPKGTKLIEYLGEKITKAESERRAEIPLKRSKISKKHGAVYIFYLNKRYDLDGDVPYNPARFINHSCSPNCETQIIRGHIWIISKKKIKEKEEITYNYGYDMDNYKEHVCNCKSENCVGYILAEKYWKKLTKKTKVTSANKK